MSAVDVANQEAPGWRYYMQRPVIVIFFLGFSSGLPFPLVYSTLTGWLEDADIQRSTISTFAWLGFAYSFKFLWSPLVDALSIPVLTRWLGRRRAWLLCSQVMLGVSLFVLANTDPSMELVVFTLVAVTIAFLSATQDIVVDAYRIEVADQELQGVMAASYQYGYRVAVLIAMAGVFYIADFWSWTVAYKAMAACMCIGMVTTLLCHEPDVEIHRAAAQSGNILEKAGKWLTVAIAEPFIDFVRRYGSWAFVLLAFIASYHVSDRVLGVLANPFYLDIGFTKSEVATVAKLYGFWVSLLGTGVGAWATIRFGLLRCIVFAPIFVATTNLLFAVLALTGPQVKYLTLTISADNFAAGFGSTVFIAFMSSLVNMRFTATQYALLASISTFFGKLFAGYSGDVQMDVGWVSFFLYAAATGIPAIVLAFVVSGRHERMTRSVEK